MEVVTDSMKPVAMPESRWKKRFRHGFGYFMLVMGGIGVFLPVWPTTPFVLVAAWCFADSPRLLNRLSKIAFFREYIESYRKGMGISRKTLAGSLIFLWGMLILSGCFVSHIHIRILLPAVGFGVSVHLIRLYRKGKLRRMPFSLIELLFVIGIITLLAGILLPSLQAARRRSSESVCRSNLKQIGLALEMYADDHRGMIPDTGGAYNSYSVPVLRMPPGGSTYALGFLVKDYNVSPNVFGCPANNIRTPENVRRSWETAIFVQSGYLYRETDVDFHPLKSAPSNANKAVVVDFSCISASLAIIPHNYRSVNILYNDGHVGIRENSPVSGKLYTMTASAGTMVPPCEFIWEHADKR